MKIPYTFLLFSIFLLGCKKQEPKNPFVVEVDDKRVELILENNADYLVYDVPTKVDFVFENIEVNSWLIKGRGIMINNVKKDIDKYKVITEINYPLERSTSDTLEIELKFKGTNDTEYSQGIIKVPVKR